MNCSQTNDATENYIPRVKTPAEHHQDVVQIAQQHFALACARSLSEPDNKRWPQVISRLGYWLNRLEREQPPKLAA